MTGRSTTPSASEVLDQASVWSVGGGILVLALSPLVLPGLALIAVRQSRSCSSPGQSGCSSPASSYRLGSPSGWVVAPDGRVTGR